MRVVWFTACHCEGFDWRGAWNILPTVLTEILHRDTFFPRLREIREAGGRVFRMDVGDSNSEWVVKIIFPEARSNEQQQEMFPACQDS
jgi:hypothetical protein